MSGFFDGLFGDKGFNGYVRWRGYEGDMVSVEWEINKMKRWLKGKVKRWS